jgi:hypothetical protein
MNSQSFFGTADNYDMGVRCFNKTTIFLIIFVGSTFCDKGSIEKDALFIKANSWLGLEKTETQTSPVTVKEKEAAQRKKSHGRLKKNLQAIRNILLRSDPLGAFRKRKKKTGLRPLHLRLVKFNGFKRRVSNTTSFVRRLDEKRTLSYGATYVPLEMRAPFDFMKLKTLDLSLGFRQHAKKRLFFQGRAGLRYFRPNSGFREFFRPFGNARGSALRPYLTLGGGVGIIKKLPVIRQPLVLRLSYTLANDFKYPGPDPFGYGRIRLAGWSVGFSVRFKI